MNSPLIQCPKCRAWLLDGVFNQPELAPCPACGAPLQIEIFPAFFRKIAAGRSGEAVIIEGESSCFYHPQKKAVVPCDACGRFLCALCDCELKGQHLCPSCLEASRKKQTIQGLEDERPLHRRQVFVLSVLPILITGPIAVFAALRYWKSPTSIVQPMRWAMPLALFLGSLQTAILLFLIVRAFIR
jgi:hypothetical protein